MAEFGGIELQDLILPGLLGVLGSWNRDTGRGVALGIEAYQQLQDAQQAKKFSEAYKRIYDPRVAQIKQELTGLDEAGNAVDLNETAYSGFHQQYGPKLANPKPDLFPQRRFSDLYSTEPSDVLGLEGDRRMDLGIAPDIFDRRPEEGQPKTGIVPGSLGLQDVVGEVQIPEGEAEWGQLKDPTEVASRREKLENELRFLQVAEVLGGANPSSAGWALAQWEQGERGKMNDLDVMAEQLMAHAYDRDDRLRVELNILQAKAGNTAAELNLRDWFARLDHKRAMERRPDYSAQPWGTLNVDTGEVWQAPNRSRASSAPKPAQVRGEFMTRLKAYEENKTINDPQTVHNYWVILKQSFDDLVEQGLSAGIVMPPEPPNPSAPPGPEQPGSLTSELGLEGIEGRFGLPAPQS